MRSAQMFCATPSDRKENRGQSFELLRCSYNVRDFYLNPHGLWVTTEFKALFEEYCLRDCQTAPFAKWDYRTNPDHYRLLVSRGLYERVVHKQFAQTLCRLAHLMYGQINGNPGMLDHVGRSNLLLCQVADRVIELRVRWSSPSGSWYMHATEMGSYISCDDSRILCPTPILVAVPTRFVA